ncbi:hypothetical protein FGO68_gene10996 [Halteria grandinella]|uniref:Uncharacterized protein n=1 Tax=Halteria grandinella TaxID=5974 RepID=A0A8J8TAM6_HALGN|nr:hypothetical protein FGO68_gene10996 [Halteria grandinella]
MNQETNQGFTQRLPQFKTLKKEQDEILVSMAEDIEQYPSVIDNHIKSGIGSSGIKANDDIDEGSREAAKQQANDPLDASRSQEGKFYRDNDGGDYQENEQTRIDFLDDVKQKELLSQFDRLDERSERGGTKFGLQEISSFSKFGDDPSSESGMPQLNARKVWKICKERLFKINYVLLYTRACSKPVYQLLMLFEFFQHMFLTFYGWGVRNEFKEPLQDTIDVGKYVPKLLQSKASDILNVTAESIRLKNLLQKAQTIEVTDPTWYMDDQVKLSIPSLYLLNLDMKTQYLNGFWASIAFFYGFIIVLLLYSANLHGQLMGSTVSSTTKMIAKGLSFLMILLLTVLQIPFFVILLQAFNCSENPLTQYTILNIQCESQERAIMVPFAIVAIMIYSAIFIVETHMLQIMQFGSEFPWAGNDRHTLIVRLLSKLVLLNGFIFDKNADNKAVFILVSFVLFCIQLYRRFQGCNYYDAWINFMHTFYDVVVAYHLFFIGVHLLAGKPYKIAGTLIFLLSSIIFHSLYYILYNLRNTKAVNLQVFVRKSSSEHCEMFMQLLFTSFDRSCQEDQMFFYGCLKSHIEQCSQECSCEEIFEKFEHLHKFVEFKKRMQNFHKKPLQEGENSQVYETTNKIGSTLKASKKQNYVEQMVNISRMIKPKVRIQEEIDHVSIIDENEVSHDIELDGTKGAEEEQKEVLSKEEEALQIFEEIMGNILEQEFDPSSSVLSFDQSLQEQARIRKLSFKYFGLLIELLIQRFPQKACYRLHLASLYKYQLGKQFKAIYELVSSQTLQNYSLSEQFLIYQLMGQIEQELELTQQSYVEKAQQIDVVRVYDYNRQVLILSNIIERFLNSRKMNQWGLQLH